jgi:glutamate dehydrogenase (NAD(P)+)
VAGNEWLKQNEAEFAELSEKRRKAAVEKLETVIRRNMEELVEGLCRDHDSLPCEVAEQISVSRIAEMEKSRQAKDVMEQAPTIAVDRNITQAAQLLVDANSTMVCVVSEKGNLIGIVTHWDITRAMAQKFPMDSPLTRIMTADVITAGPEATIIDCIRILENNEISAMPIVSGNLVAGIISSDILAKRTLYLLLQTMI